MLKTHGLKRLMTVDSNMNVEEVHKDGDHEDMDAKLQEAWDDVSGAASDPKEVRQRQEGLEEDPSTRSSTPTVQDREGPVG